MVVKNAGVNNSQRHAAEVRMEEAEEQPAGVSGSSSVPSSYLLHRAGNEAGQIIQNYQLTQEWQTAKSQPTATNIKFK